MLFLAIASFVTRAIDLPWLPYAMGNDEAKSDYLLSKF